MAIDEGARCIYTFGPFRLDPREQLLTCDGKAVSLAPKALEMLLLLVQNAGRLMEKDALLRQLWPQTFVEEGNLTKHVSVLRKALSEFSDSTEYLETVPKRGYRFVIQVAQALDPSPALAPLPLSAKTLQTSPSYAPPLAREAPTVEEAQVKRRRRWRRLMPALGGLALAVVTLKQIASPGPPPRAVRITQLTHSGRAAWIHQLLMDGSRLYFVEKTGGHWGLAWAPVAGGDPVPIPTPFPNTILFDISPDRSELLLGSFQGYEDEFPLWIMPTTGGSPRRVGNLNASDAAAWLPDGKSAWYTQVLLVPLLSLGLLGASRSRTLGKIVAAAFVLLFGYLLGATYWVKLIPLYSGFEGRTSLASVTILYTEGRSTLLAGLNDVCLLPAPVILSMAAFVSILAAGQQILFLRLLIDRPDRSPCSARRPSLSPYPHFPISRISSSSSWSSV